MDHARVGIFEEHDELRENIFPRILRIAGHEVVLIANSLGDGWQKIDDLAKVGGDIDVAIVDLDPGQHRENEYQAETIAEILREKFGEAVKIISIGSTGETEWADAHVEKMDLDGLKQQIKAFSKP